jgi:amphi-Trp domain-containing protein
VERREAEVGDEEKPDKGEFEYATVAEASRVAGYLNAIAEGLLRGDLDLGACDQHLHLSPGGVVRLELEATSRPGKGAASLQLEISWKVALAADEERGVELEVGSSPREPILSSGRGSKDYA